MFGRRTKYTLNITIPDDDLSERAFHSAIAAARADVTATVIRRLHGELLIAVTGPRLDVEKVDIIVKNMSW